MTIELEVETEPIKGQILGPDGRTYEFSGYMGLIETFERLRPPSERPASSGSSGARPASPA